MSSADDDLLHVVRLTTRRKQTFLHIKTMSLVNSPQLLTNLRNTAATFGDSSPQYQSVYSTVYSHLLSMREIVQTTTLTEARRLATQGDEIALSNALSRLELDVGKATNH